MEYSSKNQSRGLWGYTFLKTKQRKPPKIFRFFTLPLEILCKKGFTPANSVKLCCTPWKFQGKKWRSMEIQHIFSISMKILYIYIIHILFYSSLLTRGGFWNHCPMEPVAVFLSLSKFGYVRFCSFIYNLFHCFFFPN